MAVNEVRRDRQRSDSELTSQQEIKNPLNKADTLQRNSYENGSTVNSNTGKHFSGDNISTQAKLQSL